MSDSQIIPTSKYSQDPSRIVDYGGESFIVDKNGKQRFRVDGSSVKINGRMQCIKKSNNSQYRCVRYAVTGTTVCQMHGAGSFRKGRPGAMLRARNPFKYDKLPPDLQERYQKALQDPDIYSMVHEIALVHGRVEGIINSLPDEQRVAIDVRNMVAGLMMFKDGRIEDNDTKMGEGLHLALSSMESVAAERGMWDEMLKLFNNLDRLKTREVERRKMLKILIPVEMLKLVVDRVGVIINEFVPDQETRNKIAGKLYEDLKVIEKKSK